MTHEGFAPGPSVRPAAALENWLKNHEGRLFRLPVVIKVAPAFLGVQIEEAFVGYDPADAEDALRLALDDSGMMTSLLDHLRNLGQELPGTVTVWLDGTWGPLVDMPPGVGFGPPGTDAGGKPFAVREVVGLVQPGSGDTAYVQI